MGEFLKEAEARIKAAQTPDAKKVFVVADECISCGACVSACPTAAISMGNVAAVVDRNLCVGDYACMAECPVNCFVVGPEDARSSGKR